MNMGQPSCNDLNCNINGWEAFGSIPPNVTMPLCGIFDSLSRTRLSLLLQLRVSRIIICEGRGDSNLVGSVSKLCFLLFL